MQEFLIDQSFQKKTDLSNLKSDVDKLDIDKLKMYQVVQVVWKVS